MPRPIYEVKAEFFKTLAHPARIRVLEVLARGPRSVSALQPDIGIEASHLSQQLAVLRKAGVVEARREGTSMIYSVPDPTIFELLEVAKRVITKSLTEAGELLADLADLDYEQGTPAG